MVVTFAIYRATEGEERRIHVRDVTLNDDRVTSSRYVIENLVEYLNPVIEVPVKFYDIIDIYLDFLQTPKPNIVTDPFENNRLPKQVVFVSDVMNVYGTITDVDTLIRCFHLESYFIDEWFLDYLMVQAYGMWDEVQLRTKELPNDELFYLHVPFPLIPSYLIRQASFCRDWVKVQEGNGGLGAAISTGIALYPHSHEMMSDNITTYYYTHTVNYYPNSGQLMELRVMQYSLLDDVTPIHNNMIIKRYMWSSDGVIKDVSPEVMSFVVLGFKGRPADVRQMIPRRQRIKHKLETVLGSSLPSLLPGESNITQPATTTDKFPDRNPSALESQLFKNFYGTQLRSPVIIDETVNLDTVMSRLLRHPYGTQPASPTIVDQAPNWNLPTVEDVD